MKNLVHNAVDSTYRMFVNASGVAKAAGSIVLIGSVLACLHTDVAAANGSTGTAYTGVTVTVTKQSADVMTKGQIVGFDLANQRADSTFAGNCEVIEDAGSGKTEVIIRLAGERIPLTIKYTCSAGDDSANAATINTGLGQTAAGPVLVQIESTGGVKRSPQGANTWGTSGNVGKLTINDSGLAVNEIIHLVVYP